MSKRPIPRAAVRNGDSSRSGMSQLRQLRRPGCQGQVTTIARAGLFVRKVVVERRDGFRPVACARSVSDVPAKDTFRRKNRVASVNICFLDQTPPRATGGNRADAPFKKRQAVPLSTLKMPTASRRTGLSSGGARIRWFFLFFVFCQVVSRSTRVPICSVSVVAAPRAGKPSRPLRID